MGFSARHRCVNLLASSWLLSLLCASCGGSTSSSGGTHPSTKKADSGTSADAGAMSGDELVVSLADGKVQGDMAGNSRLFLKIPFAKPPVGDLRWKAPVKNESWTGVRHETEFAMPCAQCSSAGSPASSNEDCLYLNVWAPSPMPKKAPVMVWIHGGGNFAGSTFDHVPTSQQLWFNGQHFAENHGVVLVTTNYRLGPMGFFAHPALADEHSPLGNQGLRDQIAALQWVKANIAKFGGDPGNVTIFGESAGSADVCYHVASPLSRGLFHRAISESGGCTRGPMGGMGEGTSAAAADGMLAFTKTMGCDTASDALKCLRDKSVDDVMANAMQPNPMGAPAMGAAWSFSVVVEGDGGVLPDQPRNLFDQGNTADALGITSLIEPFQPFTLTGAHARSRGITRKWSKKWSRAGTLAEGLREARRWQRKWRVPAESAPACAGPSIATGALVWPPGRAPQPPDSRATVIVTSQPCRTTKSTS
jgi:Carboxylesterase family